MSSSFASLYRRFAGQLSAGSALSGNRPQPPRTTADARTQQAAKATLRFMASNENRPADYSPASRRRVPESLAGLRLDQALARMFPEHSRSRLPSWLRDGHIRLDARAAKPKQKIWGGEEVEIRPQPDPSLAAHRPERIALAVVHE